MDEAPKICSRVLGRTRRRSCSRSPGRSAPRTPAGSSRPAGRPATRYWCRIVRPCHNKVAGRARSRRREHRCGEKPVQVYCVLVCFALWARRRRPSFEVRTGGLGAGAAPPTGQRVCRSNAVTSPPPPAPRHRTRQGWAGRRDPSRHWGGPRAAKDLPGVGGPGGCGWGLWNSPLLGCMGLGYGRLGGVLGYAVSCPDATSSE